MTEAYEWRGRIGDVWAEEWRRTDRTLAPVNDALVAAAVAEAERFDHPRILDVGCGAGATSLALAAALADAEITGIDLSETLIAAARDRAGEGPGNLRFEVADAARWAPARAGFDLIVSRHGVMFFDDPVAAFAHLRALAGADARLVFSCFRRRADNQWVTALRAIFERFAPEALAAPDPPVGPFAFADPARIAAILTAAGFAPPDNRAFDFDFVAGAGEDPVADAVSYFRRIGPFAALLRTLDGRAGEAAIEALTEIAARHRVGSRILFRAAAWLVTAKVEKS
ncbi:MAG TPA: class I SAM-dependent methyltransferase [Allosphingosinicella sp.]|nr:class I SAM-dependent methyltransferase [Allosphingosinicella sp.]